MKNQLEFKFKVTKNPKYKLIFTASFIFVMLILALIFHDEERLKPYLIILCGYSPIILLGDFVKVYRYNKRLNNYALIITSDKIPNSGDFIQLNWFDVKKTNYKIKHIASYLTVEIEDDNRFIKCQKWYKRPVLWYNKWRFETPFAFNLEKLDGDAFENFNKIEKFVKENNLLQTA